MRAIELIVIAVIMCLAAATIISGCDPEPTTPKSTSGSVKKASVKVKTQASGLTIEQENVKRRLEVDNKTGSIKHLYVISAYSGQAIIYSTVRGKVTSSGKRLSPYEVACMDGQYVGGAHEGIKVGVGGYYKRTPEVLQDDGTYGSSTPYLYWWDTKGIYHQHYVSGGQIIHISDQPLVVKGIIINMELAVKP